uniref:Structural maintenance of chromosomes protein 6 n=1 Tax=Caenorhabditis japonica TaxID=281687 RepID=A0A8R1HLZ4_CAEJA
MSKRNVPSPNENVAPVRSIRDDVYIGTPTKRPKITDRDSIAVAGRVASVKLQNFMCHANLLIEFKTRENNCFYIGGPNGSGKSALFAAINLGLGGKGSDNDRGSTVKSYIKDGTNQAKVTITLTNEGLNAHPDFDEYISVERTINQTSSTYVMKSISVSSNGLHQERIISKKKSDVDRIINRFNIHLANPAFWMSQDRSRSFLANFKPSNVYKLYLESTNLENIRHSYERFATTLSECKKIVDDKANELRVENQKLKRMQEQRALQDQLKIERALVASFKWKLMFCSIRDIEDQLMMNANKMELHKDLRTKCKTEYSDNRIAREKVEKKAQELTEEVEVQQMEVEEVQQELNAKMKILWEIDEKVKAAENQLKRKNFEKKETKKAIAEAQNEVKVIMEKQGCVQMKNKLDEVEKKYNEVSKERERMELGGEADRLKDKLYLTKQDIKRKEDERYDVKRQIGAIQKKVDENQNQLRRAKAMKKDTINKYGSSMAEILQEINRSKSQFEHLPKGPVGKFITLTDPQWSYAVEECMRNLAGQFLCSSQKDAAVLRKCFDRLRLNPQDKPTLIVTRFLGRAHSNLAEPSSDFDTIYRYLKFSDPDVHNAVIDKVGCESILLFREKTEAMEVMGSDYPPQHAVKAYTLDGSQAYAGGPGGQYRFYAGKSGRASGIFLNEQENVDENALMRDIEAEKENLRELESKDLKKHDSDLYELKSEEKKISAAIEDFEKKLSHMRSQEIKSERMLKDLRKEVADAASEDRLDNLNEGIEELESKIPKIEEEVEEIRQEIGSLKTGMEPTLKEKAEAESLLNQMNGEVKDFSSKTLKLQRQLAKYDEEGDVLKARLDKLKADEDVMYHDEARLKTEKDHAADGIEIAKQSHPMPPGEQDPPDLQNFPPTEKAVKKLNEMERTVDKAELGCDQSITTEFVKEFKEKLKKGRCQCRLLEEILETLAEVHRVRVNTYPLLKTYTEMKVCDKFKELLDVRGHFIGGLEFDHEKETLNVNVQSCKEKDPLSQKIPEDGNDQEDEDDYDSSDSEGAAPRRKKAKHQKKQKKPRDLKGLSGGERSFVTASLVMSLWEVMEQPFRMMDEFDVFMDMMNRKLVMDLLVELATKKFPHNQFIFFTPQGIKELKKVDGLQIFEMNKVRD